MLSVFVCMQSPVYAMLPPFVKALGPVKEWFSTWFVSTFIAKYKDISDTASFEKVRFRTESSFLMSIWEYFRHAAVLSWSMQRHIAHLNSANKQSLFSMLLAGACLIANPTVTSQEPVLTSFAWAQCVRPSVKCPVQTKAGFLELRKALKANNDYVLGEFSYADITMAVALQAIEPVGPPISK